MLTRSLPIVLVCLFTLLTACSTFKKEEKITSEAEVYQAAESSLQAENWEAAIRNLQKLEEHFPFGAYAEQGQLELIYAYYNYDKSDEAIAAASRFIRLHPQHRNVDYAHYMMGLSAFTKGKGMFERAMPTDIPKRDPGDARESLGHFTQLLSFSGAG